MSPVFAARRRAEEFNSLVEGAPTRELHDTRTMELAALAGALRRTAPVQPRAAFVSDLRERLMAEAATALAPAARQTSAAVEDRLTVAPRRSPRERRIAAAVGGIAIVGATTSMAVAAQSALPGETLYPLKRAMENAQTGFSVSDSQKGSTLLDNATGRLDEVQALSYSEGDPGTETTQTVVLTFATFMEQASEASELLISDYEDNGSAQAIAELRDFTAASMEALAQLESVLPDGARAALIQAAQLLTQIDAEAAALCAVCGGEGISVIPPFAITAVEDVVGGLTGAFTRPADVAAGPRGQGVGDGKGSTGRATNGGSTKGDGATGQGAHQPQQPSASPSDPSIIADGSSSSGDGDPRSEPGTLGDVVDGVLGGGTSGAGGTGGNASTPPSTVPEVVDEVVEGVGDVIGGVLPDSSK